MGVSLPEGVNKDTLQLFYYCVSHLSRYHQGDMFWLSHDKVPMWFTYQGKLIWAKQSIEAPRWEISLELNTSVYDFVFDHIVVRVDGAISLQGDLDAFYGDLIQAKLAVL